MSGLVKSIGKVFKKAVKVIKKVALPVLAIGAVVLTGGAALGLALPTIGGLASSAGLSALAPILTTAGQGALAGGAMAALSGKNIIKGVTKGFVTGGVMGGFSAALGGVGAAGQAGGTAAAGSSASTAATTAAGSAPAMASYAPQTAKLAALPGVSQVPAAATGGFSAATGMAASAPALVQTGAPAASGGGFLSFLKDPIIAGNLISGVGQGIMANQEMKQERRWLNDSYSGLDGLKTEEDVQQQEGLPDAGEYYNGVIRGGQKYAYDRNRGRIAVQ